MSVANDRHCTTEPYRATIVSLMRPHMVQLVMSTAAQVYNRGEE